MNGKRFYEALARQPEMDRLPPQVAGFLKDYLSKEKVVTFDGRQVINTHFPPYPSRAFDGLVKQLCSPPDKHGLYSVTLAVTNRCEFQCKHCYNAGRSQEDLSLAKMQELAADLQERGTVRVTLTGGEPLLRDDLEEICRAFDDRTSIIVGTTGWGLTLDRAKALRDAGVFAMGISLDSDIEAEHDANRNRPGSFRAAQEALAIAGEVGLYPYIVTMASHDLLKPERFYNLLDVACKAGALEVHLLEPSLTGRLAGQDDVALTADERRQILRYQEEVAHREAFPILSTFTYLESSETFGCGAGLNHIYIDGSGELCPCNLVPMSFGNVGDQTLDQILDDMRCHFKCSRSACVGKTMSGRIPAEQIPTPPEVSAALCQAHLPAKHGIPAFQKIHAAVPAKAGIPELRAVYNEVNTDYDEFWVSEAGKPVHELVQRLALTGDENIFEAGCGTGFATDLLAAGQNGLGRIDAADLSEGMLNQARTRLNGRALNRVHFRHGDALELLRGAKDLDLVFTTWVLGYIPLRPFFHAAAQALAPDGRLAFVVHRDNSPREPMELFRSIVAEDPTVLLKAVDFDFPTDAEAVERSLLHTGFASAETWGGSITFRYDTAEEAFEHLLKSGAGTVFYEAVREEHRERLTERFLDSLREKHPDGSFPVTHDYVGAIAVY